MNKKGLNLYFGSLLIWSFLTFSILKLIMVFYLISFIPFLTFSVLIFWFVIYYYIKSSIFLSFLRYLISYILISGAIMAYNYLYSSLVLIKGQPTFYRIWILYFIIGIIPALIFYFFSAFIRKRKKARCI
jgi:hypothetical protein